MGGAIIGSALGATATMGMPAGVAGGAALGTLAGYYSGPDRVKKVRVAPRRSIVHNDIRAAKAIGRAVGVKGLTPAGQGVVRAVKGGRKGFAGL